MRQAWNRLLLVLPLAVWSLCAMASDDQEETPPAGTGGTAPSIPTGDQARAREEFQEGQRLYVAGNYRDAVRAFQAAYEAWHHPHFLWNIAQSYRRSSQWTEALNHYNRYMREYQQASLPPAEFPQEVHLHIADCLFELNRPDEAMQALHRYVDQYPEGQYRALAEQCIQQRRAPSVVDRRDPDTVRQARQIYQEATALHQRQQYREAAERFLEGYRQHGSITEFLYNAAASYRMGRMWADAIREYQRYVETAGAMPDAFIELAQCLHEQGRYEDAVAAYRRYLQQEPQGTFAQDARQYIQTMTAASSGGGPLSQEDVQRATEHARRGTAHHEAGRYREALQEYAQGYDIVPDRTLLWNMAMCYLRLREWDQALTAFENDLRGGDAGEDAVAHLAAAECEIELHQPERARQHIEDYLRRADRAELPNEEAGRRRAQSLLERCESAGSSR
jgi:tetratricopeptide (TPR) repeat protein